MGCHQQSFERFALEDHGLHPRVALSRFEIKKLSGFSEWNESHGAVETHVIGRTHSEIGENRPRVAPRNLDGGSAPSLHTGTSHERPVIAALEDLGCRHVP